MNNGHSSPLVRGTGEKTRENISINTNMREDNERPTLLDYLTEKTTTHFDIQREGERKSLYGKNERLKLTNSHLCKILSRSQLNVDKMRLSQNIPSQANSHNEHCTILPVG